MPVETFFAIRIKDRAGCFGDAVGDIPDGIVCCPSGTESTAVCFAFCFPCWFKSDVGQCLPRSLFHRGNTQGAFFLSSWLRNPHAARRGSFGVTWRFLECFCQPETCVWGECFHSVSPGGLFSSVVLCDLPYGQETGCPGYHGTALQSMECLSLSTL